MLPHLVVLLSFFLMYCSQCVRLLFCISFLSFITISKQNHTPHKEQRQNHVNACSTRRAICLNIAWHACHFLWVLFFALLAETKKTFWFRSGDVSSRAKRIYFMENKFWPNWRDQRQNKRPTKYVKKNCYRKTNERNRMRFASTLVWNNRTAPKQRAPNGKVIKIFVFFIRPLFSLLLEGVRVDFGDIDRSIYTLERCIAYVVCRRYASAVHINLGQNAGTHTHLMWSAFNATQQTTKTYTHDAL